MTMAFAMTKMMHEVALFHLAEFVVKYLLLFRRQHCIKFLGRHNPLCHMFLTHLFKLLHTIQTLRRSQLTPLILAHMRWWASRKHWHGLADKSLPGLFLSSSDL